jgi:TetR/AcrR family fatty acid metabolism transcriptional regulator
MTDLAERDLTTESKGERTRRRILEIAIERFGERGYRATSVSEIARAAGLTQAASYAYFDSKESLFQAAVDADAEGLITDVAAQAEGVPIDALIPSVIVYAVMSLADHPLARRVLAGQEPDEIPRLVELPSIRLFGDLIGEQLRLAQLRGEVRQDLDAAVLAAGIESLVMGLLFTAVQTGGAATERHQIGVVAAFDLMIRPPR